MKMKNIKGLKAAIATSKNIVIVPHKNPDGDAMGSTLALYDYLCQLQKKATVIAPNEYPHFLKWLPNNEKVVVFENNSNTAKELIADADLIFTLDFNHLGRCGDLEEFLKTNEKASFVMIDHHQQPDDYAKYMYSDPSMCSTCEMIYHFMEEMEGLELLNKEIATCLYTGIMTDTGSFRYRSTTSTTHRVIANLIDAGAKNTQIHEAIYDTNTLSKLQLKGVALTNLRIFPEFRTVYISITQKELNDHNFKKGDTEGFVNIGLSIDNIVFAVIFIENENEGIIKMSFRSKGDFSVNQFARNHFEGGGHDNAAGGKSDLNLMETIEKFMTILPQYKTELLDS